MSAPEPPGPSYDQLAALVVGLVARVETLEAENAELRRRLGMNSTNSSVPPSKDSIEAKAKRRAEHSSRERSSAPPIPPLARQAGHTNENPGGSGRTQPQMIVDQGSKIKPATPSPITDSPQESKLCQDPAQRGP